MNKGKLVTLFFRGIRPRPNTLFDIHKVKFYTLKTLIRLSEASNTETEQTNSDSSNSFGMYDYAPFLFKFSNVLKFRSRLVAIFVYFLVRVVNCFTTNLILSL